MMKISENLKFFFASCFQEAFKNTISDGKREWLDSLFLEPDGLSIIQHFEEVLDNRKNELAEATQVDKLTFNSFMPALRQMVRHRKMTMGFTSFVAILTDLIRYIIIWLNLEKGFSLDIEVTSRRKSLIGELNKILIKSHKGVIKNSDLNCPPIIRDRFGLRIILTEDNPELLLKITTIIVTILTNSESDYYIEFTEWLKNCNDRFGGEEIPKRALFDFLEKYHLQLMSGTVKDYVSFPKLSTYQSWQATLAVDATSFEFCGFMFELQTRTWAMHENAELGSASHDIYKQQLNELVEGVFEIKDYQGGISLYSGPDHPDLDLDGISEPKRILSRHVSPHVSERMLLPTLPAK